MYRTSVEKASFIYIQRGLCVASDLDRLESRAINLIAIDLIAYKKAVTP